PTARVTSKRSAAPTRAASARSRSSAWTPARSCRSRKTLGATADRARLPPGDDPQRTAAAAPDHHGQRGDHEVLDGEPFQPGDVLERGHVRREQDHVALEEARLAVVDAGRVEADGLDRPRLHEPLRRFRVQTADVELGPGLAPRPRRPEIRRAVAPARSPAGLEEHDRAGRDLAVADLPGREVRNGDAVVPVLRASLAHVDMDADADE